MKLILIILSLSLAMSAETKFMTGGNKDVDDEEFKAVQEMFTQHKHLLKDDNEVEQKLILITADKITKQVVAGVLYKILGIFEDEVGKRFNCEVHIWDKPWIPNSKIVTLKNKEEVPDFLDKK